MNKTLKRYMEVRATNGDVTVLTSNFNRNSNDYVVLKDFFGTYRDHVIVNGDDGWRIGPPSARFSFMFHAKGPDDTLYVGQFFKGGNVAYIMVEGQLEHLLRTVDFFDDMEVTVL